MKTIETLSSLEGRRLLREIFYELRYEKQLSSFATLTMCWRICTHEKQIHRYVNKDYSVAHSLGFFSGTSLWMQEIVNRFYFTTINSLVYLGAAILLVLVGVRRFSDSIDDSAVIAGIIFEAMMLIFMFIVMLFSPRDDDETTDIKKQSESETDELIVEIGEIGTEFASAVANLEQISNSLNEIIHNQTLLTNNIGEIARCNAEAIAPNPKLIEVMNETNSRFMELNNSISSLNQSVEKLKEEKVELLVRKEVEKIISNKVLKKNEE
jgi:hypothetical protein